MMIPDKKMIANAVGGKTARACDYCIQKRARWYCAADDAFLCQLCDSSVHSANRLARRHERVRLKTASVKRHGDGGSRSISAVAGSSNYLVPSWHRGLTRRSRTPRHGKQPALSNNSELGSLLNQLPSVVPDDDVVSREDESEEQLLYRVPIFDRFVSNLCTPAPESSIHIVGAAGDMQVKSEVSTDHVQTRSSSSSSQQQLLDHIVDFNNDSSGLFNDDVENMDDLSDFAADVETLLGSGLGDDDQSYGIEDLGLLDSKGKDDVGRGLQQQQVKAELYHREAAVGATTASHQFQMGKASPPEIDAVRERFELSFNYDSPPTTCEEHDAKVAGSTSDRDRLEESNQVIVKKRKILLSLDYEAVSAAWNSRGSPWMYGLRRTLITSLDDCWPRCLVSQDSGLPPNNYHAFGEHMMGSGLVGQTTAAGDGGREARVSRYREKRRTRLFSKKIRYEVRKLNAEKRPRMKGRFVKRSSFPAAAAGPAAAAAAASFPLLANYK
ncbi:hypothetical protein Dimus_014707 [Dionaea muscipula]